MPIDELASLIAWLKSRALPNSGIDFEADSYKGGSPRTARTTLWGEDAKFIAEHFHGRSAADLAAAIERLLAERDEARKALKPFSDHAGELFARNWNASDVVHALDNPGDPHTLTAGDFFSARLAMKDKP